MERNITRQQQKVNKFFVVYGGEGGEDTYSFITLDENFAKFYINYKKEIWDYNEFTGNFSFNYEKYKFESSYSFLLDELDIFNFRSYSIDCKIGWDENEINEKREIIEELFPDGVPLFEFQNEDMENVYLLIDNQIVASINLDWTEKEFIKKELNSSKYFKRKIEIN